MSGVPELQIRSEKYEIVRELGRGGMGIVYLAEDRQLKRLVALKVLYDHLNRDNAFVTRFQDEARSVSTLHHPNIVCVHGLERAGDVLAIDMEYVEGLSLDLLRASSRLTPYTIAGIARDVLGGLVTCHHIGVVHRDIKPSNILINQEGMAKITDFGLATAYASHLEATVQTSTSSGFYMGTPRYMPIEAWEGSPASPHWDLYSLGVVLFELLSGRAAFSGDNPMAIMKQQLTEPLPTLTSVGSALSPELARLVDDLIRSNSTQDFSSADALAALQETPEYRELRASNASTTLTLPPARKAIRVRKKGGFPRPTRRVAAVFLTVVVLVGAAWWAMRPGSSPEVTPPDAIPAAIVPTGFPTNAEPVFVDARAVDPDGFGHGTWMIERDERGAPVEITGISELGVWTMSVGPGDANRNMPVSGSWAASLSVENRLAHFGSLNGILAWDPTGGTAVLSVDRIRARDSVATKFSVYARAKPPDYDRRSFLRELESNAVLQRLIYGELLGRGAPWGIALESQLPALPGGRVAVPVPDGPITVDGRLDEPTWVNGAFDSSGRVGEVRLLDEPDGVPLRLRWTGEAVYFAARIGGASRSPRFELGVMPSPEISVTESGRFYVSLDETGAMIPRHLIGDVERAWHCDWEIAMAADSGDCVLEGRIPLESLKESARPRNGKRWRINARVTAATETGPRGPAANWSDGALEDLEHGVLVVFQGTPE